MNFEDEKAFFWGRKMAKFTFSTWNWTLRIRILLLNVCSLYKLWNSHTIFRCQNLNSGFFPFSQNSIRVQINSHKCFDFYIKHRYRFFCVVPIYIKHYYQIRIRSAISIIFDLHRILRWLKTNSIVYSVLFCACSSYIWRFSSALRVLAIYQAIKM